MKTSRQEQLSLPFHISSEESSIIPKHMIELGGEHNPSPASTGYTEEDYVNGSNISLEFLTYLEDAAKVRRREITRLIINQIQHLG